MTLPPSSYRHATLIVCTKKGRNQGIFANGTFPYFALVEMKSGREGVNIVPVLPDGRLIMIIEERPAVSLWRNAPRILDLGSGTVALTEYQSVEFPAGGVNPGESPADGALRELQEETGIGRQAIEWYCRCPLYPLVSDVVLRSHLVVAFLSEPRFAAHVQTDGGLSVLALTEDDIERNIQNGVLADAGTVLSSWSFYKTVREAKANPERLAALIKEGFLTKK